MTNNKARIDLRKLTFALLWLFIFAMPWETQIVFPVALPASHLIGGAVAVVGLTTALLNGTVRRLAPLHYVAGAFVAWASMSYAWSIAPELTAVRITSYAQLFLMVWLIWEFASDAAQQRSLMIAYVLGTWLAAGSTIWSFLQGMGGGPEGAAGRYTAPGENENELGIILAIGVAMASYLLSHSRRSRGLWFLSVPVFFLAIVLTGSRGSFLASMIALLLFPMGLRQLPASMKAASAIAVVALIAASMMWLPDSIWTRVQSIPAELSQGTLTKRTDIWSAGIEAFRNHSFLGVGAGAFEASVYRKLDIAYVAHNSYLSVLVELGVVGILLFGSLLLGLLGMAASLPSRYRSLWLVLLFTWGVAVSSVTWEHRKPTWFIFGLLIAQFAAVRTSQTETNTPREEMAPSSLQLVRAS